MSKSPLVCRNANPGTFNHECGKPAAWIAVIDAGSRIPFCDHCRADGIEGRRYKRWEKAPAEDLTPEGIQLVIPGAERVEAPGQRQFTLF